MGSLLLFFCFCFSRVALRNSLFGYHDFFVGVGVDSLQKDIFVDDVRTAAVKTFLKIGQVFVENSESAVLTDPVRELVYVEVANSL